MLPARAGGQWRGKWWYCSAQSMAVKFRNANIAQYIIALHRRFHFSATSSLFLMVGRMWRHCICCTKHLPILTHFFSFSYLKLMVSFWASWTNLPDTGLISAIGKQWYQNMVKELPNFPFKVGPWSADSKLYHKITVHALLCNAQCAKLVCAVLSSLALGPLLHKSRVRVMESELRVWAQQPLRKERRGEGKVWNSPIYM